MKKIFFYSLILLLLFAVCISCAGPIGDTNGASNDTTAVTNSSEPKSQKTKTQESNRSKSAPQKSTKEQSNEDGSSYVSGERLIVLFVLLYILLCAILFKKFKEMDSKINDLEKKFEELKKTNPSNQEALEKINSEYNNLKNELDTLRSKIVDVGLKINQVVSSKEQDIGSYSEECHQPLKHDKENRLKEESDKNRAFYMVTYKRGETEGSFVFHGNAEEAIKNRNSIIEKICDTEGDPNSAKQIEMVTCGECVKQSDGIWIVTKKAKIIYK